MKKRYRLRKKDGNYFSGSAKTIFLKIPVTSETLKFEEPVVNISTSLMNAVLVKLIGDESPTLPQPVVKEISIKFKSEDIKLIPKNLKRDGFLVVAIYNDSNQLDTETIEIFKQIIIDSESDYIEAVSRLRQKFEVKIKKPKENDGDVIGGNA
ncbi:hypothetical protein EJ994_14705 [Maribacter sp. MJ134]|uniref:hypothetical protein n=1 Tax=Maribacter sp. MJ134 TaxID=2496865 RepID=UPI000F84CE0B|nr:hypothetical protein [Maribacter sp. MJ134]AZQ59987.1 hypothetical protein EJ994_14705 [Maribacter sp. MJ134]